MHVVTWRFPDPRGATPQGVVAVGGRPEPALLEEAYARGIFPWPMDGAPLLWFCPAERGVLFFDELHIPRSLARERKRTTFHFTIDRAFEQVIRACAEASRPDQSGTWIKSWMIDAYCEFHRLGHAHSVEVWENEQLVGGVYGVDAGGAFAGESMFHLRPNASKLALLHLMDHLRTRGLAWLDIQVMTPHMKALGARLIPREQFLDLLAQTQKKRLKIF